MRVSNIVDLTKIKSLCLDHVVIAAFVLTMSCTTDGRKESEMVMEEDGKQVSDSLFEPKPEVEEAGIKTYELPDAESFPFYDSIVALLADSYEDAYEITVSTDEYEASSSISWYLNEALEIMSYKQTYSIEGMEGSSEYYFENGQMVCFMEDESAGIETTTTYYCKDAGGVRITRNENSDEVSTEKLVDDELPQKQDLIEQYLTSLIKLLADNEITSQGEGEYTIIIEEEVEIGGEETTSRMEIRLPRNLYEKLVDD